MGLFIRKSFKAGPVRINLSKSGLGVSAGPKGMKAGIGPKGAYISGGKGSIRYREYLNSSKSNWKNKNFNFIAEDTNSLDEIFIDTGITYPKKNRESDLLVKEFPDPPEKIKNNLLYYIIGGFSFLLSFIFPFLIVLGLFSIIYGYFKNKEINRINNQILIALKSLDSLLDSLENDTFSLSKHLNISIVNCGNENLSNFYKFISIYSLFWGYFNNSISKKEIINASKRLKVNEEIFNNIKEKAYKDIFDLLVSNFRLGEQEEIKLRNFIETFNIDKNSIKKDLDTIQEMHNLNKEMDSVLQPIEVDINLKNEKCFYKTESKIIKENILKRKTTNGNEIKEIGYVESRSGITYVTNKRILTVGSGSFSVDLNNILDIVVTPKANILEITLDNRENPIIYTTPHIELFTAKIQKIVDDNAKV